MYLVFLTFIRAYGFTNLITFLVNTLNLGLNYNKIFFQIAFIIILIDLCNFKIEHFIFQYKQHFLPNKDLVII